MAGRNIIVVGGSAGSLEAITALVGRLPPDFPGSVFLVVHFPGSVTSTLPGILSRAGPLPARHARDGEPIQPGTICVAPPDYHLHLSETRVRLIQGPKESGHRPAIDPLFRTAAHQFGARVVGVVLSGNQNDGTAGLLSIKQHGGLAVVQSPDSALYPSMPRSAIEKVGADHVLAPAAMAGLLSQLAAAPVYPVEEPPMAAEHPAANLLDEAADPDGWEPLEAALWTALRTLEERTALARLLAARSTSRGHTLSAAAFTEQALDAERHASVIRNLLHAGLPRGAAAASAVELLAR